MLNPGPQQQPASERSAWIAQIVIILAALVCGTAFWLVIQLTTSEEAFFLVEVRPEKIPDTVRLRDYEPREVHVKFSFPRALRDEVKREKFYAAFDLQGTEALFRTQLEATQTTELKPSDIRSSVEGVTPIEVLTPRITWSAELRHALGRVQPVVSGEPAEGFRRGQISVDGRRDIQVRMTNKAEEWLVASGSELLVIPTQPLDVTGATKPVRQVVDLLFPAEGMEPMPGQPRSATVVVDIVEQTETVTIESFPLEYRFVRENLRAEIDPPTVNIVVTGRMSAVRQLTAEMIRAELWGVAERPGESREIPVECRIIDPELRPLVTSIEAVPRSVTVRIIEASPMAVPPPVGPLQLSNPETTPGLKILLPLPTPNPTE